MGNSAAKSVRISESGLEHEVSKYIGDMPFLWLEVNDAPSRTSRRAYMERNCIRLLSSFGKEPIDAPSANWLGNYSFEPTIRQSGLWNTNHVDEQCDSDFLEVLANFVGDRCPL